MENILIYGGLGILLAATMVNLIAALRGYSLSRKGINSDVVKKTVSKLTKPAMAFTMLGFILIGIGAILSSI